MSLVIGVELAFASEGSEVENFITDFWCPIEKSVIVKHARVVREPMVRSIVIPEPKLETVQTSRFSGFRPRLGFG